MASVSLEPLLSLTSELSSRFVGREREVAAVLTALVAGEPAFLCGPPGTAKTALVEEVARSVNARYYYYLLTRFTEPDEILGPLNIPALREGRWERVMEGRLPTAEIAFLDEIFKASSAVRNVLLDIILNRRVLNGGSYVKLPLLTLYTASNEVSHDAEDAAFYDRLTVRAFVNYVPDALIEDLLIRGAELSFAEGPEPTAVKLSVDYVRSLQALARARALEVAHDPAWRERIAKAFFALREKGIALSDRRKVKTLLVFAAVSVVFAEQTPSVDSLADALRFIAPQTEEDASKVERVIIEEKLASYDPTQYYTLIEEAQTLLERVKKAIDGGQVGVADLAALKELRKRMISVYNAIPTNMRTFSLKSRMYTVISEMKKVIDALAG